MKLILLLILTLSFSFSALLAQELKRYRLVDKFHGEEVIANMILPESKIGVAKVEYLTTAKERERYKVTVKNSLLYYQGSPLSTLTDFSHDGNVVLENSTTGIYVISTDFEMYFYPNPKSNLFHHSSFVAGYDVLAAGDIIAINGEIASINYHSGHYLADIESYRALNLYLKGHDYEGYIPTRKDFGESLFKLNTMPSIQEVFKRKYCSKLLL